MKKNNSFIKLVIIYFFCSLVGFTLADFLFKEYGFAIDFLLNVAMVTVCIITYELTSRIVSKFTKKEES